MMTSPTINIHNTEQTLLEGLAHLDVQLNQILDVLSEADYVSAQDGKSSIGEHTRHIIEFIQAVTHSSDIVNYDARKRNLHIQTSKSFAQNVLTEVIEGITNRLNQGDADKPVHMVEQLSNGNASVPVTSTLGREIAYAIQHGIHHIFIIKTQAEMHGISIGDDIGVAPATVTYQNQ